MSNRNRIDTATTNRTPRTLARRVADAGFDARFRTDSGARVPTDGFEYTVVGRISGGS